MINFIEIYEKALPVEICNSFISYFEKENTFINKGTVYQGVVGDKVVIDKKNTLDMIIPEWNVHINPLKYELNKSLDRHIEYYYEKYKKAFSHKTNYERVGYYLMHKSEAPAGGFTNFHSEWAVHPEAITRQMVAMWYLNDVEDGGETEFYYQKLKIKPKTGTLVIHPAGYTHLHRGHNPISNNKYTINTWLHW